MKTPKTVVVIMLTTAFLLPIFVNAADIRGGSEISIPEDLNIEENLYIGSSKSNILGDVQGDLSVASGETFVKGVTDSDVLIVSGNARFEGESKGDTRIAAGNVYIKGKFDGDLAIVGGEVFIDKGTEVSGDILIIAGRVKFDTDTSNYMHIIAGEVIVNGTINGDSTITTQKLILNSGAVVNGTLNYFSPEKALENNGSKINGEVKYNQTRSIQDNGLIKQAILSFINFWIVLRFVTALLLSFLLVYIFKVFSQKVADYSLESFGTSLLIGLSVLVIAPVISVILFVSLIAMPIAFLLTFSFFFVLIISTAVSGIILGALIKKVIKKEDTAEVSFQTATLGIVLLTAVQFVPIAGDLIRLIFFTVAIGAISHHVYMNIRWRGLNN